MEQISRPTQSGRTASHVWMNESKAESLKSISGRLDRTLQAKLQQTHLKEPPHSDTPYTTMYNYFYPDS